ncbi:acyltransferase [Asanoa ishikariensis]|uniref:Acyltransferase family protein n=1 Tax=Asanoa ishikariensis TaxID=137265 RepID=A0A1H3U0T0_9ACTN|nr:acyltransferase family protein [Asanoa ishikariensis]GIF67762.1 acyltransferase [Asanoa ishikariensis]SDZ55661.1 Acyltransferase family protein [Asanoa ishikariensis]
MNPRRDAGIDAVRALAIAGVVVGHWLVTALVIDDGALHVRSPLAALPAAQPVSWLLQTLGLFFLAGGYAAAASSARRRPPSAAAKPLSANGTGTRGWRRLQVPRRLAVLLVPVGSLLGLLALALTAGALAGVPEVTLRTVGKLVVSPLWFLLPFLALTALITPIARLVRRCGPLPLAAGAAAVVLAADLGRGFLPTTLIAAWTVPFVLGVALAQGRLARRRTGWLLLASGAAAVAALVFLADYPTSAVGVPGEGRSNLDPPSLAAVALAVAQTGAVLLLLPWLRRLGTHRAVRALNGAALPVYLWHQATMISVTVALAWFVGRRPGLLAEPDDYGWAAARLAWLPLFAGALVLVVRIAGSTTAGGQAPRPYRTVGDQPSGQCRAAGRRGIESPLVRVPGRRLEVIAVRDSDPPSRSRAAVRSR